MMNKFEKRIKDELNSTTPDLKENIKSRVTFPQEQKQAVNWKRVAMPIMAVMVLLVAIITPIVVTDSTINAESYTLTISVNPSVEINYGKDGYVTDVRALNKDGIILLQSTFTKSLQNTKIDTATSVIIDELNRRGYFETNSEVRVTVKNDKGQFNKEQFNLAKDNINKRFVETNINGKTINQMTEEELDALENDIENNADKYYSEVKDAIEQYLVEKQPLFDTLVKDINAELVKMDETLVSKQAIKDRFKKDKTLFANDAIKSIIEDFVENHPLYEDDFDDIEDMDALTGEDFYELYEEIVEELEEVNTALDDIKNGRIPNEIDDMIEDMIEGGFFN